MKPKRVKVISDGTPANTRVIDESDNKLTRIKAVRWEVDANGGPAKLTLVLNWAEFESQDFIEAEFEPCTNKPTATDLSYTIFKHEQRIKELQEELKELEWLESLKQQTEIKPL